MSIKCRPLTINWRHNNLWSTTIPFDISACHIMFMVWYILQVMRPECTNPSSNWYKNIPPGNIRLPPIPGNMATFGLDMICLNIIDSPYLRYSFCSTHNTSTKGHHQVVCFSLINVSPCVWLNVLFVKIYILINSTWFWSSNITAHIYVIHRIVHPRS